MNEFIRIGIIGFGEVGKIFAQGLSHQDDVLQVKVWDIRWKNAPPNAGDAAILNERPLHNNKKVLAQTATIW